MNLPFFLDIAIGLIFIYLILSLLASEIQELIAALLQWRAKHLRESITNLLEGGERHLTNEQKQVQELVKKIYDDPLIRNINQTAVEGIASFFRWMTWLLPDFYNWIVSFVQKDRKRTFDNFRSAPSYIPAETFATTLIESIGISDLSRLLMQQRLKNFTGKRLGATIKCTLEDVCSKSGDARERVSKFERELKQIIEDYTNDEATLKTCTARIMESLDRLIAFFEKHQNSTPEIKNELQAIKANYFGRDGERALLFGLSPSPSELIALIDKGSRVYQEVEPAFRAAFEEGSLIAQKVDQKIVELKLKADALKSLNLSESEKEAYHNQSSPEIVRRVDRKIVELEQAKLAEENHDRFASTAMNLLNLSESDTKTYEIYRTYQKIDLVIDELPKYVRDSLQVLARRAESRLQQVGTQVQRVDNEVERLRIEIEAWFDRSMDRASGVYKRNAKGFAIVLGFVLAAASNSDTFHVFSRLSDDEKLRQVIVQRATSISQNSNPQQPDYDAIREEADKALKAIPLPIGWSPTIVKQQLHCDKQSNAQKSTSEDQQNNEWQWISQCESVKNPFTVMRNIVTMLAGWLVSGIAIAMGAPFWFDLLGKVVNVRNTGKPPKSSTTHQTTSSSQPNAPGS